VHKRNPCLTNRNSPAGLRHVILECDRCSDTCVAQEIIAANDPAWSATACSGSAACHAQQIDTGMSPIVGFAAF
jgi:MinD superfamily P-loop ATPase